MEGNVFHFAGSGVPVDDDGSLDLATFSRPNGIAAFGNALYVNTTPAPWFSTARSSIAIRKITLPAEFE